MNKLRKSIRSRVQNACIRLSGLFADRKGDLATNTIGGIIVVVVIIGLLIAAINKFYPTFFTTMFNSMQTKLNANW